MSSRKQIYKKLRKEFREQVFQRDNYTCQFCDVTGEENLDAHHITDRSEMPFDGYVVSNGISLCADHHYKAEKFHMSGGHEWEKGMHPDDLYDKIDSSKEKAIADSKKLKGEFDKAGIITINVHDRYQQLIEKEFDNLFSQISTELQNTVTNNILEKLPKKDHEEMIEYFFEGLSADLAITRNSNSYNNDVTFDVSVDLLFNDPSNGINKIKPAFIHEVFTISTTINRG